MSSLAKKRQNGFTLVEVLIAATLTAGLFAGLWTLFGIFTALESRSDFHAARARIARGVVHQIQDDLNRIVIPPRRRAGSQHFATTQPLANGVLQERVDSAQTRDVDDQMDAYGSPKALPGSASEVIDEEVIFDIGRIALRGGENWMIMDFSQARSALQGRSQYNNTSGWRVGAADGWQDNTWFDHRRIVYSYVSPEMALVANSLPAGLSRWEIPANTSLEDLVDDLRAAKFGSPASRLWEQLEPGSETTDSFAASSMHGDRARGNDLANRFAIASEEIPELERFLIRYYGDGGWTRSWDSRDQGLPAAIECLVVWRDVRALPELPAGEFNGPTKVNSDKMPVESLTNSGQDADRELDKARVLDEWERLGEEDLVEFRQPLPPGFSRYLFCLPSAPIAHRSLLEKSDPFSNGASR